MSTIRAWLVLLADGRVVARFVAAGTDRLPAQSSPTLNPEIARAWVRSEARLFQATVEWLDVEPELGCEI